MENYRAFVYRFLSVLFSYPDEETLEALENGLGDVVKSLAALGIPHDANRLAPLLARARARIFDLQGEHTRLFATSLKAPWSETAYERDKLGRKVAELSDIEGFYRAFGLVLSAPIEPDSVVAELEFLSLLVLKARHLRERGDPEGADICAQAREKFLSEHLGRWYKLFTLKLAQESQEEYYSRAAELLDAFLAAEATEAACASGSRL